MNNMFDKMHEECGVMGFYDKDGYDVAKMLYLGLFALQHRGESSCGIVTDENGVLHTVKQPGLVSEAFDDNNLASLKGSMGIGHVRFKLEASNILENIQPISSRYSRGTVTLANNGNITNASQIKATLEDGGSIFQSGCGCEIVTHLLAKERVRVGSMKNALLKIMTVLEGAYSMVVMSPRKMFGMRDPHGYRPLCIGKLNNSYILCSESVALDAVGAKFVRDVLPGELVLIDENGLTSFMSEVKKEPRLCIFEYIYFARPDSVIDDISVYEARMEGGRILYRESPQEADVVIGIPSSGLHFALGYSLESGIPFGDGLIKNVYFGKGIQRADIEREAAVNIRLNILKAAVKDKRIILIDDSLIKGTTNKALTAMLKASGAKEVHIKIASPPIKYICNYGADVPARRNLIAASKTIEEIKEFIGCDSIHFLSLEGLSKIGLRNDFGYCKNCLIK